MAATSEDIDFHHEYQKLKTKLTQVEEIIRNKAKLQEKGEVLKAKKAEAEVLKASLHQGHTRVLELSSEIDKLKRSRQSRLDKYFARLLSQSRSTEKTFDLNDHSSKTKRLCTLKKKLELARENVAQAEEEVCMEEERLAIEEKAMTLECLNKTLPTKESWLKLIEDDISTLERESGPIVEKLEQKHQKWREHESITSLSPELEARNQRISALEEAIKERDEAINRLRQSTKTCTESLKSQHTLELSKQADQYLPLLNIGTAIRNRNFEHMKERPAERNNRLIRIGNSAAHEVDPIADAALFQSFLEDARKDRDNYILIYGFDPDFVWKNRFSVRLTNILHWCVDMRKVYYEAYQHTEFAELCDDLFLKTKDWTTSEFKAFINESDDGKKLYDEMRGIFEDAMKKNKKLLRR